MGKSNRNEKMMNLYKRFNLVFFLGIALSAMSGVGSAMPVVSESMVISSGIMGLVFVGVGYAGKRYFIKQL